MTSSGGLAAPALAAVGGSLLSAAGAGATAGAVTGFVGSSVGSAAVIGAFGAGGAHAVGSRMARRLGALSSMIYPDQRVAEKSSVFCIAIQWHLNVHSREHF